MSVFDYLSVLFSVILSLALTEILQGWRALIQARSRIVMYWPALIWSLTVLLIVVQDWWSMFGLRRVREWDFQIYAVIIVLVILLYLVAGLSVPEVEREGPVDMRKAYFAHAPWFFLLFAGAIVASLYKGFVIAGVLPLDLNFGFHAFYFAAAVVAALSKSRWYHAILAPVVGVSFVVYIAVLFARI